MVMFASTSVALTKATDCTVMPAPKVAVLWLLKCEYWPISRTVQYGRG
jgi:hypothetical protein